VGETVDFFNRGEPQEPRRGDSLPRTKGRFLGVCDVGGREGWARGAGPLKSLQHWVERKF